MQPTREGEWGELLLLHRRLALGLAGKATGNAGALHHLLGEVLPQKAPFAQARVQGFAPSVLRACLGGSRV